VESQDAIFRKGDAARWINNFALDFAEVLVGVGYRSRHQAPRIVERRQYRGGSLAVDAYATPASAAVMMSRSCRRRAAGVCRRLSGRSTGANASRIQQQKRDARDCQKDSALGELLHALNNLRCKPPATIKTHGMAFCFQAAYQSRRVPRCGESPILGSLTRQPQRLLDDIRRSFQPVSRLDRRRDTPRVLTIPAVV